MLGERDSEVCVVFEDTVMMDGKMNGESYPVGQFCHSLRSRLFKYVRAAWYFLHCLVSICLHFHLLMNNVL